MSTPQRAFWSSKKTGEGNGWQKGTDGKWYQYKGWEKTGVVKQHLTPGSRVLKGVSRWVKGQQKLSQNLATKRKQSVIGKGTADNPQFIRKKGGSLKPNPKFKPKSITTSDKSKETVQTNETNNQLKVNQNKKSVVPNNKNGKKFVNKVGGDAVNPKTPTTKSNTITHPNYKPRKLKPVYEHHRGTQAKIGTGASPLRNRGPIQTQRATFSEGARDVRNRLIKDIPGFNEATGMRDRANFKALGLDIPRDSISVTPKPLGQRNFSNITTSGQVNQLRRLPEFSKGIRGMELTIQDIKNTAQAQAQAAAKLKEAVQPQGGDQTPNVDQTTNVDPTQRGGGGTQSQVTTNAVTPTNTGVPAVNYQNLVQQPWAQQAFNPASQGLAISGVGAAPLNIAKMPTFIPPPTMFTPPPVLPPMAFPTTGLSIMGAGAG